MVKVYTIGHSNRPLKSFVDLLKLNRITLIADIRSLPGSNANPQFNRENLEKELPHFGIKYIWIKELGGRRHGLGSKSPNKCWKNPSFRGYADYMMTNDFRIGIKKLLSLTKRDTVAIMCGESLYWRCHRVMVSDYLKALGLSVFHIIGTEKPKRHLYTPCAKVRNRKLKYY